MTVRGFLALLLIGIACGGPGTTDRPGAEAEAPAPRDSGPVEDVPEVAGAPEAGAPSDLDPSAVRARRRAERLARGEVVAARFEGEFVSGGLPDESTQAIPIGAFDLWYVIGVRVVDLLEGELPGGWTDSVNFAVHSPAILFGTQGIQTAPDGHVPEGRYVLTVWAQPNGGYDLDIEPKE